MKSLRFLFAFLTLGFVLSSCQKDFSFEAGNAKGTLAKDALGDCVPSLVNGNFYKDTALNATNYVDVQVDIIKIGVYTITTDTVNGYYFIGTGTTGVLGLNTIRLFGKGKPIIDGFDSFIVSFNGSICTFDVPVNLGAGGGGGTTAIFTFPNAAACTGAFQTGNFIATLPTNPSTHFITLLVNVTQAGTYNLSTTTANNLTFTASGSFTATGNAQPIILRAQGNAAPGAQGITTYNFSTTTPTASSCAFDLTVLAAPSPAVYQFTCASSSFAGTYQVGTAMTSLNTITIPVNVTSAGGYNITTTVNGVTFAGAGIIALGAQSITLNASGTPLAPASPSTTFVLSGGGGPNCSVTIPFSVASTSYIRARIGSATSPLVTFNNNIVGTNDLTVGQDLTVTGDGTGTEDIGLEVTNVFGLLATNTDYNVNQLLTTFIAVNCYYHNATGTLFEAVSDITPQPVRPFTVRFSTIQSNRLVGTFSGNMADIAGGIVAFYGGEFDITF